MRKALPVAAPSLLVFVLLGGNAVAQPARDWLERMNRAVDELNYSGTFVHVLDGTPETLHIVHRHADGQSGERILSLDGARREIVRQGARVQGIFPDRRIVLFETRRDVSPLATALPSNAAALEPHYVIELGPTARVADRSAQLLEIKPRDEFRYGYVLWLDRETAMPLKSHLVDEQGNVVEEILFTDIEFPADIPASALEPTIDTTGFITQRATEAKPLAAEIPWRAAAPPGFKLSVATESQIAGSDTPVGHLVYSDGLATVSVFIEDPATEADVGEGFSTMGSTNVYSLTLSSGQKATAIGEVPRQTVRTIASSLVAK
ncbi:MAG TPA: MucB/RseB C-terminal domain-containing protein [Gammaproteobacteria bacterium]|jgi:sigma-E factor negative regulatory protein RseB|nr:MucB/RseB C-terminal domain-containing protein [Gammaproteobacteria bacterium]